MKYVCNYSILRFLPYPETGEFVNIGIVLLANNGEFRFKVVQTRKRVTHFFPTLDHRVYIRARSEVEDELYRLTDFFAKHREQLGLLVNTFKHLIQPRETMMRFSEPGTVATEDIGKTLEELFDHYVNHSFANKEYQEKVLERQLGNLLTTSNLRQRYTEQRLGTEDYEVRFPFVMMDNEAPVQAIKPLHLGQAEPSKIREHGDIWEARVRRLRKTHHLAKDTLFIADPPQSDAVSLLTAYEEVTQTLAELQGVRVVSANAPESQILEAIKQGIPTLQH